ncbi:guanylate kinase [Alkalicoccus daliensis]|uniref:Guanylate kinase n=1 Tax=Alkalicoccus daliensis TaxID=745820 RepID=A0A1H0HH77_9BACI|nr:guanylate kinase [Alkalicoccus daliensis]SDO18211.1 guanylate kinase [Alkalicoccus daliensis]
MKKIFILSGFAGAGKNAIINNLLEIESSLTYIPSYTTRNKREGEAQGNPYQFVSMEQFQHMVAKNDFIEYEEVHGNLYGTPLSSYELAFKEGKTIVKDIDVNGAVKFKERFPQAALIFIQPTNPEDVLERMRNRGDKEADIMKRMQRIEYELQLKDKFDYTVYNDDLAQATKECLEIIKNEAELS